MKKQRKKKKPVQQIKVCLACQRRLGNKLSLERGYGPVCFSRRPSIVQKELETLGQQRFDI